MSESLLSKDGVALLFLEIVSGGKGKPKRRRLGKCNPGVRLHVTLGYERNDPQETPNMVAQGRATCK